MALAQEDPLGSHAANAGSYATWMAILMLAAVVLIFSARGTRPLR